MKENVFELIAFNESIEFLRLNIQSLLTVKHLSEPFITKNMYEYIL